MGANLTTTTYMVPYKINASTIIPHTCTCVGVDCCEYGEGFTVYMYMYVKVVSKLLYHTRHMITVIMQSSLNTHKLSHATSHHVASEKYQRQKIYIVHGMS